MWERGEGGMSAPQVGTPILGHPNPWTLSQGLHGGRPSSTSGWSLREGPKVRTAHGAKGAETMIKVNYWCPQEARATGLDRGGHCQGLGPCKGELCPCFTHSGPHLREVKHSPLKSCRMSHLHSARCRHPAWLGLRAGKG